MLSLVRVDDRLLHGQIICAWVPFVNADELIVASDEAAGDALVSEIMGSCSCDGLGVSVTRVEDVSAELRRADNGHRAILIFANLADAMRAYDNGLKFTSINIGNVHHEENGRRLTNSVVLNPEDDGIIERFVASGVAIDLRDVPTGRSTKYTPREGS